ncbi:MAG: radical SAM protein [Anaerolineaceae bacterium]|nr:radical SAM protein [Anaerolineaceae bacterium]
MILSGLEVHSEKLNEDLWLLERNGTYIAFSPLSCKTFVVKQTGIYPLLSHFRINPNPKIESYLQDNGFYNKQEIKKSNKEKPFSPNSVVLSLTSSCNLRCKYCYANSGSNDIVMEEEIGKSAIRYVFENTTRLDRKSTRMIFHGGGEAMVVWPLMVNLTEYAKKNWGERVKFSVVTNATLITPERADWLVDNKFRISVSMDGPQSIQDYQRPMINQQSSFLACYKGVSLLKEKHGDYGIRATVTKKSAKKIDELVKIAADFNCGLKLEPFTAVGRGLIDSDQLRINPFDFAESFLKAESLGNKLGVEIKTSFLNNQVPGEGYCGGNGNMYVVTPTGAISSCSRAVLPEDSTVNNFFIGKVYKNKIVINPKKVEELRKLTPDNFTECNDCYAKWYCRGGCHHTRISAGGKSIEDNCVLSRWFLWLILYRKNQLGMQDDLY